MAPTPQINIYCQMNIFRKLAEPLCAPRVLRKVDQQINSRPSLPVIRGINSVSSQAHTGRVPLVLHSIIR